MVAACAGKGVVLRFSADVAEQPDLLAPFDRIVVATGADYRFGLGPLTRVLLDWGIGRWPGVAALFSAPRLRDWFYYRARCGTAGRFMRLARPGQTIIAIGDAVAAGKSKQAIASAFEAALLAGRSAADVARPVQGPLQPPN
jgi:hypothetical protein